MRAFFAYFLIRKHPTEGLLENFFMTEFLRKNSLENNSDCNLTKNGAGPKKGPNLLLHFIQA